MKCEKKKSQWRLRWKEFQAFQRNSQCFITLSDKPATWKSQLLFDTVIKYQTTLTFFKTTYGQCSFSQSESPSNVVAFDTHGKTFVWEQNPLGFSFYSSSRMRNCRLFSWQHNSHVTKWSRCKEVMQLVKYLIKNYGSWNISTSSMMAYLFKASSWLCCQAAGG